MLFLPSRPSVYPLRSLAEELLRVHLAQAPVELNCEVNGVKKHEEMKKHGRIEASKCRKVAISLHEPRCRLAERIRQASDKL
jgi:hypothetical protein